MAECRIYGNMLSGYQYKVAYLATSRTNGASELFKRLQQLPFRGIEISQSSSLVYWSALVNHVLPRSSSHLLWCSPPWKKSELWGFHPCIIELPAGHKKNDQSRPLDKSMILDGDQCLQLRDGTNIYADIYRPLKASPFRQSLSGDHTGNQGAISEKSSPGLW